MQRHLLWQVLFRRMLGRCLEQRQVWVLSGYSLLKGSGKNRLVSQKLAASGPVLLGLLSAESWTLEFHLGKCPGSSGKCSWVFPSLGSCPRVA